jgi:acyl carrier protein
MGLQQFLQNFSDAVDFQQPIEINAQTTLKSLPEWDSLAALGVIVMCDLEYQVTITGDQLSNCDTVGDIFNLITNS